MKLVLTIMLIFVGSIGYSANENTNTYWGIATCHQYEKDSVGGLTGKSARLFFYPDNLNRVTNKEDFPDVVGTDYNYLLLVVIGGDAGKRTYGFLEYTKKEDCDLQRQEISPALKQYHDTSPFVGCREVKDGYVKWVALIKTSTPRFSNLGPANETEIFSNIKDCLSAASSDNRKSL